MELWGGMVGMNGRQHMALDAWFFFSFSLSLFLVFPFIFLSFIFSLPFFLSRFYFTPFVIGMNMSQNLPCTLLLTPRPTGD